MKLEEYIESGELREITNNMEDETLESYEYLLKISGTQGYMTKKNKNGTVPKPFIDWYDHPNNKVYVIKETFRKGWKLTGHRLGKSQAWAVVTHPFGFTMEVNLAGIVDTLQKSEFAYGEFLIDMKFHQAGKTKQLQSLMDL